MNKKQSTIEKVLEAVLSCCNIDDLSPITISDIRGKDRRENVLMTRCIFVSQMLFFGYSRTTIAAYLGRSEKSIGNILAKALEYQKTSRAYKIADAESTLKVKDIIF